MNVAEQNQKFDALEGLYDGQIDYLLISNRVATTRARLDVSQAVDAFGLSAFNAEFDLTSDNRLTFGGRIITSRPLVDENDDLNQDAWQEAYEIACQREWDEEVEGMLINIHPDEDEEDQFPFLHN